MKELEKLLSIETVRLLEEDICSKIRAAKDRNSVASSITKKPFPHFLFTHQDSKISVTINPEGTLLIRKEVGGQEIKIKFTDFSYNNGSIKIEDIYKIIGETNGKGNEFTIFKTSLIKAIKLPELGNLTSHLDCYQEFYKAEIQSIIPDGASKDAKIKSVKEELGAESIAYLIRNTSFFYSITTDETFSSQDIAEIKDECLKKIKTLAKQYGENEVKKLTHLLDTKLSPKYKVILDDATLARVREYRQSLIDDPALIKKMGSNFLKQFDEALSTELEKRFGVIAIQRDFETASLNIDRHPGFTDQKLEELQDKIKDLTDVQFLELLIRSKKPKSFAENARFKDGFLLDFDGENYSTFGKEETEILERIIFSADVTIFDNAGQRGTQEKHGNSFEGNLIFVPGPVFKGGFKELSSFKAIVKTVETGKEVFSDAEFKKEIKVRLLPTFLSANDSARAGKKVFVTIPGISCGAFGDIYGNLDAYGKFPGGSKQIPRALNAAIKELLKELTDQNLLPNIAGVLFDSFAKDSLNAKSLEGGHGQTQEIGNVKYITQELSRYGAENQKLRQQLNHPENFGAEFAGCTLVKLVAADALAVPGNDFNIGSRATDEGNAAAATDIQSKLTGFGGKYLLASGRFERNKYSYYLEDEEDDSKEPASVAKLHEQGKFQLECNEANILVANNKKLIPIIDYQPQENALSALNPAAKPASVTEPKAKPSFVVDAGNFLNKYPRTLNETAYAEAEKVVAKLELIAKSPEKLFSLATLKIEKSKLVKAVLDVFDNKDSRRLAIALLLQKLIPDRNSNIIYRSEFYSPESSAKKSIPSENDYALAMSFLAGIKGGDKDAEAKEVAKELESIIRSPSESLPLTINTSDTGLKIEKDVLIKAALNTIDDKDLRRLAIAFLIESLGKDHFNSLKKKVPYLSELVQEELSKKELTEAAASSSLPVTTLSTKNPSQEKTPEGLEIKKFLKRSINHASPILNLASDKMGKEALYQAISLANELAIEEKLAADATTLAKRPFGFGGEKAITCESIKITDKEFFLLKIQGTFCHVYREERILVSLKEGKPDQVYAIGGSCQDYDFGGKSFGLILSNKISVAELTASEAPTNLWQNLTIGEKSITTYDNRILFSSLAAGNKIKDYMYSFIGLLEFLKLYRLDPALVTKVEEAAKEKRDSKTPLQIEADNNLSATELKKYIDLLGREKEFIFNEFKISRGADDTVSISKGTHSFHLEPYLEKSAFFDENWQEIKDPSADHILSDLCKNKGSFVKHLFLTIVEKGGRGAIKAFLDDAKKDNFEFLFKKALDVNSTNFFHNLILDPEKAVIVLEEIEKYLTAGKDAAENGTLKEQVKALLLAEDTPLGRTPFSIAVIERMQSTRDPHYAELVQKIINLCPEAISQKDCKNNSPLHWAIIEFAKNPTEDGINFVNELISKCPEVPQTLLHKDVLKQNSLDVLVGCLSEETKRGDLANSINRTQQLIVLRHLPLIFLNSLYGENPSSTGFLNGHDGDIYTLKEKEIFLGRNLVSDIGDQLKIIDQLIELRKKHPEACGGVENLNNIQQNLRLAQDYAATNGLSSPAKPKKAAIAAVPTEIRRPQDLAPQVKAANPIEGSATQTSTRFSDISQKGALAPIKKAPAPAIEEETLTEERRPATTIGYKVLPPIGSAQASTPRERIRPKGKVEKLNSKTKSQVCNIQ